jgi:alanyl-tRNA synthetase
VIGSSEFRRLFLDFFREKGHEEIPSSKVVPADDPTLLFTNAGMNQFKDIFLGLEKPGFSRAASVQKCIRVSGKHNDLEDVGKDGTHHTFFEMLGNWSFGDYYKKEAIEWSWEFVTQKMGLPEENLWASVYKDDQEAFDIWADIIKIDRKRIVKLGDLEKGDEENFWSMGVTGPCGPCSEIHYDHSPAKDKNFVQGSDNGEIVELWNLVFMEFNRGADQSLTPLPEKHIDTGLGLERALSILQGVDSNYKTDLFVPLFSRLEEITGKSVRGKEYIVSGRVITDHIRSLAFAIADGVVPSNEGRGYVLRRILRRAVRHGKLLGLDKPFLYLLIEPLVDLMGEAYNELIEKKDVMEKILLNEEELFIRTLDRGLDEFGKAVSRLKESGESVFPGKEAFLLHDTYGFPLDLTEIIAEEQGLSVDRQGFEKEMDAQRKRAQQSSKFSGDSEEGEWVSFHDEAKTGFTGYTSVKQKNMKLLKYRLSGDDVFLVFDKTPFYGESGGQIGDTGYLESVGTKIRVKDVKKTGDLIVHIGSIEKGEIIDAMYSGSVDTEKRKKTMANHTATHLMHHALRKILGSHVAQAGSFVGPDRLRFDFNHYGPLTDKEISDIEMEVNVEVFRNVPVSAHDEVPIEEAKAMGAMALFGEKYGKNVRVVDIGGFSIELCGGTHVERTGDIGLFKIVKESSISSGVRRIEAVTREAALGLMNRCEGILKEVSGLLDTGPEGIAARVKDLQQKVRDLEKERKRGRKKDLNKVFDPEKHKVKAGKYSLVILQLDGMSRDEMREISDRVKNKLKMGVIFISSVEGDKVAYVLSATDDAIKSGVNCGSLLREVLKGRDASGGGRPNLAEGGGKGKDNITGATQKLKDVLASGLS